MCSRENPYASYSQSLWNVGQAPCHSIGDVMVKGITLNKPPSFWISCSSFKLWIIDWEHINNMALKKAFTTWHCLLTSLNSSFMCILCSNHKYFPNYRIFRPLVFIYVYFLPLHPFFIWLMPTHTFKLISSSIVSMTTSTLLYTPEHPALIFQSYFICCGICCTIKFGGYCGIRPGSYSDCAAC